MDPPEPWSVRYPTWDAPERSPGRTTCSAMSGITTAWHYAEGGERARRAEAEYFLRQAEYIDDILAYEMSRYQPSVTSVYAGSTVRESLLRSVYRLPDKLSHSLASSPLFNTSLQPPRNELMAEAIAWSIGWASFCKELHPDMDQYNFDPANAKDLLTLSVPTQPTLLIRSPYRPRLLLSNHLSKLWLPLQQDLFLVLLSYLLEGTVVGMCRGMP